MTRTFPSRARATRVGLGLACLLVSLAGACDDAGAAEGSDELWRGPYVPAAGGSLVIEVPPPPFSDGVFPCSDCHDDPELVNRNRRRLSMSHQEIELRHAEAQRWCLDCHDPLDRDHLRLANGDLVPFEESYRLCGQCHGTQLRDWKAGVHGRRSGSWSGEKQYLLCVHCHDAHSPRFRPLTPEPAPLRPRRTR